MLFTETGKARVTRIIEEKMASGKYPVADLKVFDSVKNLDLADDKKVKFAVEFTRDEYIDYLKQIKESLSEYKQKEFCKTLRNMDIVDNQALEKEDSFLVALGMQVMGGKKFAISEMINNYGKPLTQGSFLKYHDLLLRGTSSYDKLGYRDCNTKFVGSWPIDQDEPNISYFPIDYRDVLLASEKFVNYYNENKDSFKKDYDAFIKPIIYHGLIASLQMFNDGNTRYGRLFQHVGLWGMLGENSETKTDLPILYATRQYVPYRESYRKLIENIVTQKDEDAWREWVIFNLHRLQDGMYKSETDIRQITKRR